MIDAWLEGIRLIGWCIVLYMLISNKKYIDLDLFWVRIIISATMMTASINDLMNVTQIHKSMYWFFGNIFIILSYIYEIARIRLFALKKDKL